MGLLRDLKQETTILFSTHLLHDAEELCDDVLIMNAGHIAISGRIQDIRYQYRKPSFSRYRGGSTVKAVVRSMVKAACARHPIL